MDILESVRSILKQRESSIYSLSKNFPNSNDQKINFQLIKSLSSDQIKLIIVENERLHQNLSNIVHYLRQEENVFLQTCQTFSHEQDSLFHKYQQAKQVTENLEVENTNLITKLEIVNEKFNNVNRQLQIKEQGLSVDRTNQQNSNWKNLPSDLENLFKAKIEEQEKYSQKILNEKNLIRLENEKLKSQINDMMQILRVHDVKKNKENELTGELFKKIDKIEEIFDSFSKNNQDQEKQREFQQSIEKLEEIRKAIRNQNDGTVVKEFKEERYVEVQKLSDNYNSKIDSIINEKRQLESKLELKRQKILDLKQKLLKQQEEKTELVFQVQNWKSRMESLKNSTVNEEMMKKLQSLIDQKNMSQSNDNFEPFNQKGNYFREREELKNQIFELKFQINDLNNDKKTQQILSENLKEKLLEQKTWYEKQLDQFQEQITQKNLDQSNLKQKLEEQDKSYQKKLERLQQQKDLSIKEKEKEINELRKTMIEDISRSQQQQFVPHSIYDRQQDIKHLREPHYSVMSPGDFDDDNRKVSGMKRITDELIEKLKQQKRITKDKQKKISEIKDKKKQYKDQNSLLNKKIRTLEIEINDKIQEIQKNKYACERIEIDRNELQKKIQRLQEEINLLKEELIDKDMLIRKARELESAEKYYKDLIERKDSQIFQYENKLDEQEEFIHQNLQNNVISEDSTKLKKLKRSNLKLKNLVLDLRENLLELQEQYTILEGNIKEEQQLREEIVEGVQNNADKFEAKIFEFEEFREKLVTLKEKFIQNEDSEREEQQIIYFNHQRNEIQFLKEFYNEDLKQNVSS